MPVAAGVCGLYLWWRRGESNSEHTFASTNLVYLYARIYCDFALLFTIDRALYAYLHKAKRVQKCVQLF